MAFGVYFIDLYCGLTGHGHGHGSSDTLHNICKNVRLDAITSDDFGKAYAFKGASSLSVFVLHVQSSTTQSKVGIVLVVATIPLTFAAFQVIFT